jgi:hypothetical protein
MRERYRHWAVRLSERNAEVVSEKLRAAWDRMVASEEEWTLVKFAREAGMCFETLQANHQDWVVRYRERCASQSSIQQRQSLR